MDDIKRLGSCNTISTVNERRRLLGEQLVHLRHHLEQVANKTEVGHLEDGRVGVLVYGGDRLAILLVISD